MASSGNEFAYQSLQDPESIVKYLEALGEGIKGGSLLFGTKKKKLILEPNGLMKLDVKARRKDRKVKLEIKISWSQEKENKEAASDILEIKPGKKS